MIDSLFVRERVRLKQREAPLLKERERYLSALINQGIRKARVRSIANILLHVVRLMEMDQLRAVSREEIHDAGRRWLTDVEGHTTRQQGKTSLYMFTNIATNWFRYNKLVAFPPAPMRPFDLHLARFIHHLTSERQFSSSSLRHYQSGLAPFLIWAGERCESISAITVIDIDGFFRTRRDAGVRLVTIAGQCNTLRAFFRFCELQGWCDYTIALGIRSPRVPKPDLASKGPCWRDVRRMVTTNSDATPSQLRTRAVISLCSIYAVRAIEITNLTLNDFDWINETFTLKRAKSGRSQQFPLQFEVGQAILDYLQRGRPRCSVRNLFVTVHTPYRPLNSGNVWEIVASRIIKLGIESERMGPHSLRHACATQLLKRGSSLRDIADFLGHRGMASVSVYAKSDVRALRAVAAFSLAGVK
jgi:integrase/recombinase XerD